jgi:hypothetical protein
MVLRRHRPKVSAFVLLLVAVAVLAGTTVVFASQSKTRDWSDCVYGIPPQPTCLLLESSNSVNDGTGTVANSVSTIRGGYHVCFFLIGRGFNDYGGWHRVGNIHSPNTSCIDTDSGNVTWDVIANGFPYQGLKSGGQYVCSLFQVTCYGTAQHRFTYEWSNPPPAPTNVTGYTSNLGSPYDTAPCFNTPGC